MTAGPLFAGVNEESAASPRRPRTPKRAATCTCPGVCSGGWDVVLIGCGAEKASTPQPAGDLYTGSLYRAHRRVLERLGAWPPTAILSALHGWVAPDNILEPYEHQLTAHETSRWGDRIVSRIFAAVCGARPRPLTALVLAGASYIEPWLEPLTTDDDDFDADYIRSPVRSGALVVDDPLRGLGVGERLAFAADFASAKVSRKHPRCDLHSFVTWWRRGLVDRRARRQAEHARALSSEQLDMFTETG